METKYVKENRALVVTALTNARNVLKLAIQYYVPGPDMEIAFNKKAGHKVVAHGRSFKKRFFRLYRENNDSILLECSGHDSDKNAEKSRPRIQKPWALTIDEQEALYVALYEGCFELRKKTVGYDCDGKRLAVGDKVRWRDPGINDYPPEDRAGQAAREWEIVRNIGDTIIISDENGDAEVFDNELEKIDK